MYLRKSFNLTKMGYLCAKQLFVVFHFEHVVLKSSITSKTILKMVEGSCGWTYKNNCYFLPFDWTSAVFY